jgi:hypothetical protein
MARRLRSVIGAVVGVACAVAMGCTAPPAPQDLPNRKQIVQDAKAAQYSLLREGMQSLHCTAKLDWAAFLEWRGPEDASEKAMHAALTDSHYDVSIDGDGTPTVATVEGGTMPSKADDAAYVRKELEGMRHTLESLLYAWTGYMASTMLPGEDVDIHMVETGGKYYLKYMIDDMAFAIDMNSKYELLHVWGKDAHRLSDVHPTFDATPKGYVLNGYTGDFADYDRNRTTSAKLVFQNETVDGLLVLESMTETAPRERGTDTARYNFSDYKVTKRADAAGAASR